MTYTLRITGPGIDHQVMVSSADDFEALELIIAKMRKHFASITRSDIKVSGNGTTSCDYALETISKPEIDQAPIARVIVSDDAPAAVILYAPGLPIGEHDLYCEPITACEFGNALKEFEDGTGPLSPQAETEGQPK